MCSVPAIATLVLRNRGVGDIGKLVFMAIVVGAFGLAVYWLVRRLRGGVRLAGLPGAPLEGFAGWLAILVGLQSFAALSLLGGLLRHMPLFERYAAIPAARPAVLVEVAVHLAVLAFVAWATVVMISRRRLFVALFRLELLLLIFLPTLNLAWAVSETNYVTQPKAWLGVAATFSFSALVAAVGFAYSLYSTRFRSTFVR